MATQTPTQRSAAGNAHSTGHRAAATAARSIDAGALTCTNSARRARQLDQFERHGQRALDRGRRKASRRGG